MLWLELDGTAVLTTEQRLAIAAAQRGNWKPADTLELERLRALVKPHDEDGELCVFPNLKPVAILRGGDRDVAKWELDTKCERCEGSGWLRDDDTGDEGVCGFCQGTGTDYPGELITDLDGLILEDSLP